MLAQPIYMGRSAMREHYACVYIKEFPAQAMLRLRPELLHRACVVMAGDLPLEQVCSLNRKARASGVARGMTKVEVETFEQITVLKRSAAEEAAAAEALLQCAGSFSPRVEQCCADCVCTDGVRTEYVFECVIDIAGTEKLFGPAETLARKLRSEMLKLGFSARIAVSNQFHTAVIAARGLAANNHVKVIPAGMEKDALSDLPLTVLDLSPDQAETFALWGISTLGMLAELPLKGLIARMGQAGKHLHELAQGTQPHLFQAVEPAFTLSEHMEFDNPVEMLDALLFVINTMLEQLIQRVTARALALASVSVTLTLEGGATHTRTVRPALPAIDRQLWLKLLHLDLEAHPPQAAVTALTLNADPGSTRKMQLGLFSPQMPEPARLDVTLARIRAIVGDENAGCAVLGDTHAPDAFRMDPFKVPTTRAVRTTPSVVRPAMRQIRPAEKISVTIQDGKPKSFFFRDQRYKVEHFYGPWLSSGDWWKPSLWGYEQWDVVAYAQAGTMLCCCVVRDVLRNEWKIVALYD
jgi:protein ImuB